jgi:hypothetical protein
LKVYKYVKWCYNKNISRTKIAKGSARDMQTWLHFIGAGYYSIPKYAKEAQELGVSRRVSFFDLKKMEFGDRVLLAQWDGNVAIAFGTFYITGINGLNHEITEKLEAAGKLKKFSDGGEVVIRGCGMYVTGPRYDTTASLPEICEMIVESGEKPALLLTGHFIKIESEFYENDIPPYDKAYMKIPHRQGFRTFNWQGFIEDVRKWMPRGHMKTPKVEGQLYDNTPDRKLVKGGIVGELKSYEKKKAGK